MKKIIIITFAAISLIAFGAFLGVAYFFIESQIEQKEKLKSTTKADCSMLDDSWDIFISPSYLNLSFCYRKEWGVPEVTYTGSNFMTSTNYIRFNNAPDGYPIFKLTPYGKNETPNETEPTIVNWHLLGYPFAVTHEDLINALISDPGGTIKHARIFGRISLIIENDDDTIDVLVSSIPLLLNESRANMYVRYLKEQKEIMDIVLGSFHAPETFFGSPVGIE